ncbi:hypothetical protein C8R47DRAFT_1090915 [Mycena vitilis]|nr:hypothetical protein C8R47DRAFT_1090915 [Mycena vitilis]
MTRTVSRSSDVPPQSPHLPDEIWTEVLAHLPRDMLSNVNLTSLRLHCLTRPLLFRKFEFHPYTCLPGYRTTSGNPSSLALPGPEQINLVIQRLRFWSTDDIAPFVRSCLIAPWPTSAVHGWSFFRVVWNDSFLAEDPYMLLTSLLDALPRFTNLNNLTFDRVHFTQSRLERLALLPPLKFLGVSMCGVAEGEVLFTSRLTPLAVAEFKFIHDNSFDGVDHWLDLLPRDTLRHAELSCNKQLLDQIPNRAPFLSVTTLKLEANNLLPWTLILHKFPALEVLTIQNSHWAVNGASPNWGTFPPLREYAGPIGVLPFLLPLPTLRRVAVPRWPIWGSKDILGHFLALATPNTVTSLSAGFIDFEPRHLEGLCVLFPNLTELRISISVDNWAGRPCNFDVDTVFDALAQHSPLPATIRKLALRWEYHALSGHLFDVDYGCPDVHELQEALVTQFPDLQMVWFDGSGLMYIWRRGHAARQYLWEDGDSEQAEDRREEFRLLWEGTI